jgi:hypothetical protein
VRRGSCTLAECAFEVTGADTRHGEPLLKVADIFRDHGGAWRNANRGHVSLGQLKVMGAIERCRTAALGGHVARCENEACGYMAACGTGAATDGNIGLVDRCR